MDSDDAVDLLENLEDEDKKEIVEHLDEEAEKDVRICLLYTSFHLQTGILGLQMGFSGYYLP